MAHLCMTTSENEMAVLPLGQQDSVEIRLRDDEYAFLSRPAKPTRVQRSDENPDQRIVLIPWEEANKSHWALVCSRRASVHVNDLPVPHGFKILSHRDSIRMGGGATPLFFLEEDPAHIAPYRAGREGIKCGRCRTPMEEGAPAVRCPGCSQYYHQEAGGRECWTYRGARHCPQCQHPTALDGTFSWTPVGL